MLAPLPAIANMSIGPACFDGVAVTLVLFYSIDCGREFIHLLKEHRDLPDLLVFHSVRVKLGIAVKRTPCFTAQKDAASGSSSPAQNLAGHGHHITRSHYRYRERPAPFLLAIDHLLDPGAIRYDGILWDHDYSVAHVKLFCVQVGGFAIRGYHHPLADSGVFVDDRSIDH
jgi:hypothetical protein